MRAGVNVKAVFFSTLLGNLDLCTWMVFGREKLVPLPRLDQLFQWVCASELIALVSEAASHQHCIIYHSHDKTNSALVTVSKAAALITAEKSLVRHANLQQAAFPRCLLKR